MEKLRTKEEILKEIEDNEMTLLYFGMDTCGVCVDMQPKIEKMLEKYPKIKSFRIDADYDVKLAAEYSIFTIPVVILYAEQKEVIREARHISVFELDDKIARYYDMFFN